MESRQLAPDTHAAIKLLLQRAQELHQEAQTLEQHARTLICKDAQIDLTHEEWTLDLAGGALTRKDVPDGADHPQ